jgi:hypothetical protein
VSFYILQLVQQLIVRVTVEVKGRETEGVDVQTKPLHKKDAAIGNKQLVYSSNLIMEQEDAASFGDNEEVSFHVSCAGHN